MEVRNNLSELRTKRAISAAQLANMIGVSRQTVYAIEAGSYIPNTTVSLKMARVLDVTVEEIFTMVEEPKPADIVVEATLIHSGEKPQPGQPLRLCQVGSRNSAFLPEAGVLGISVSDGELVSVGGKGKPFEDCRVRVADENWKNPNRLLVAGCDPSVSVISHDLRRLDFDLLVTYQNSSAALELLREGLVHMAGTHLVDKKTGEFNLARIRELFGRNAVSVICYATWEEGITVAKGNPKGIKGVADLTKPGVTIANREVGAACRNLLESLLHQGGIETSQVNGYETVVFGHLPAARMVFNKQVDACITTRAAARVLGLDFIPLATRPYHLIIRRKHLTLPAVEALIDLLGRSSFRREVEAATGYDMRSAGEVLS